MSNLPEFENYTDDKLEAARVAVLTEVERRANMAAIPAQIKALTATYLAGGGDLVDLTTE